MKKHKIIIKWWLGHAAETSGKLTLYVSSFAGHRDTCRYVLLSVLSSLPMVPGRSAFNSLPPTSLGLCNGIYGLHGIAFLQVHEEEGRVQIQHVAPDSWG